jgi:hypothetical protein
MNERMYKKTSYRNDYSQSAAFTYNRQIGVAKGVITDYEEITRRLQTRLQGSLSGDRALFISKFIRAE